MKPKKIKLKKFYDARGYLLELLPKKLNKGAGAAEACLSLMDIKNSDIYDKS